MMVWGRLGAQGRSQAKGTCRGRARRKCSGLRLPKCLGDLGENREGGGFTDSQISGDEWGVCLEIISTETFPGFSLLREPNLHFWRFYGSIT